MSLSSETFKRELARLAGEHQPDKWDRQSWIKGAQFALSWVLGESGAVSPSRALEAWWPKDSPSGQPGSGPPESSPEGTK